MHSPHLHLPRGWGLPLSKPRRVPGLIRHGAQDIFVEPHVFQPRGMRLRICTHCYGPRALHPRRDWVLARPQGANYYLAPDAPHFHEGW